MRYLPLKIFSNDYNLIAAESTRLGGISKFPYESLNLGSFTSDNQIDVTANKKLLYADLGFSMDRVASSFQCHGNEVFNVTEPGHYEGFDALITRQKNIFLQILVADCVPILLFDPVNEVVAAIHAGWRGTTQKIVSQTLLKMERLFQTKATNCIGYVGTCITQPFFEVDEDVAIHFLDKFCLFNKERNKYFIDLKGANVQAMIDSGMDINKISISPYCTVQDNHLFFSHRHEKGSTGRFGVIIGMKA